MNDKEGMLGDWTTSDKALEEYYTFEVSGVADVNLGSADGTRFEECADVDAEMFTVFGIGVNGRSEILGDFTTRAFADAYVSSLMARKNGTAK